MKLIQIPFSHNCVKVRVALARKGLRYETEDIPPADRSAVAAASQQRLVPVLVDDGQAIVDSTAILLHLEEHHPDPPLVPRNPRGRAECLLLEDWADRTFMAASRRVGYYHVLRRPGALGRLFFPRSRGVRRAIQGRLAKRIVTKRFRISSEQYVKDLREMRDAAALAVARLGEGPYLLGRDLTIADIALAAMCAPLVIDPELAQDPAVRTLLAWAEPIVGKDVMGGYR